jgi:Holliday junction resolvase RusA-like endonuclease
MQAKKLDSTSPKDDSSDVVTTNRQKKISTTNKGVKKGKNELAHWLNETDCVILEVDDGRLSSLHFQIRGNPRPLVRHRSARGHMYNPSSGLQDSFRSVVFKILDDREFDMPLFQEEDALSMTIIFRMKRAKNHFIGGRPGPGRLKENAPKATAPIRQDIDNLIKFVLDTMNKVLYHDDRQITSINVVKILDNREPYSGSTEISLRAIQEEDVETVIANTLKITQP